jgi:hypothetical protein
MLLGLGVMAEPCAVVDFSTGAKPLQASSAEITPSALTSSGGDSAMRLLMWSQNSPSWYSASLS